MMEFDTWSKKNDLWWWICGHAIALQHSLYVTNRDRLKLFWTTAQVLLTLKSTFRNKIHKTYLVVVFYSSYSHHFYRLFLQIEHLGAEIHTSSKAFKIPCHTFSPYTISFYKLEFSNICCVPNSDQNSEVNWAFLGSIWMVETKSSAFRQMQNSHCKHPTSAEWRTHRTLRRNSPAELKISGTFGLKFLTKPEGRPPWSTPWGASPFNTTGCSQALMMSGAFTSPGGVPGDTLLRTTSSSQEADSPNLMEALLWMMIGTSSSCWLPQSWPQSASHTPR